ncbi:aldo/keto reductase [Amorphoplanes nipponensis]|uniref:Oxidoreductase n=1 Tax=Actinoplanes nipponensis TaxID=135950 RepID=A0A919JNC3_9ACTN|nr:aldo/keto reductase [Actinoplanes nipponensis]GIE52793.1 oxidoreductase [Actinoplanes nipponensis]
MEQRHLGALPTSALGLGCMGLSQGYGPADDEQSVATVRAALDHGITLIDTAMSYGRGHNERLVGRAVAGRRDEVVLATKFGIVRGEQGVTLDGRPEHVRGHCDASLERLGVDTIDLLYLHRVDPAVPVAETVGAMADLVAAGKVRHLGLSEVDPEQLARAVAVHPIAAVQFEWSLSWREPEHDIVPAARRLGVGLVPYSPLGRGLLTGALPAAYGDGDFRRDDPRFAGANLTANLAAVRELAAVAARYGISAGQLALAWLLAQGPDVVPIPGTRSPARVAENAAAAHVRLAAADLATLAAQNWRGDRRSFAAHGTARTR